jgi:hypothetical protein
MSDWILLIHQIPARPLYLRARIRGLLARAGAVAVKNSVYAAPAREGVPARMQAIAAEIRERGGEVLLCDARFEDADERRFIESCRRERAKNYAALREAATSGSATPAQAPRLERRLERIVAVDFFAAEGRREAEAAIARLGRGAAGKRRGAAGAWAGRTWVTRRGVHVDRMACAWYVRRFLDPGARFRFVAPGDVPRAGEVGYDMPGGSFTHEDGGCSFETLIAKTGANDPALRKIAEIVHDIDLKDGRFGRPETAGVAQLITGIVGAEPDDRARLERGAVLFDDLHRAFQDKPQPKLPTGIRVPRPGRS